jgi:hypothetical protein
LVHFARLLPVLEGLTKFLLVVSKCAAHSSPTFPAIRAHLCSIMGPLILLCDVLALDLSFGAQKDVVRELSTPFGPLFCIVAGQAIIVLLDEVVRVYRHLLPECFFEVFRAFAVEEQPLLLLLLHAPIIKLNNI